MEKAARGRLPTRRAREQLAAGVARRRDLDRWIRASEAEKAERIAVRGREHGWDRMMRSSCRREKYKKVFITHRTKQARARERGGTSARALDGAEPRRHASAQEAAQWRKPSPRAAAQLQEELRLQQ